MGTGVHAIDGLPVTDAKRSLELHITARDCSGGDPKRPETCAAAKAIRREHGAIDVKVHLSRVYVRQNRGNWMRYLTPPALQREIVSFDRDGKFEPGVYELKPISPSNRLGKRQGGKDAPGYKKRRKVKGVKSAQMVTKNIRNGPAF